MEGMSNGRADHSPAAMLRCRGLAGRFQAGATKLHRSHSAVFTAIKNLESQLGLKLLDRKGYRVTLSDAGRSFHRRTRVFLHELSALRNYATQLAMGEETEMRI